MVYNEDKAVGYGRKDFYNSKDLYGGVRVGIISFKNQEKEGTACT
jgi:hypothetical protein